MGAVLFALLTVASAGWLVVSVAHGLVSLFALGWPFAAMTAFVLGI